MSRMWADPALTIAGVEYNMEVDQRDVLPTAYAPATLSRSQPSGLDDPDPARFTVDVTVPPDMDGRDVAVNLFTNPSFELDLDGVYAIDADIGRLPVARDGEWCLDIMPTSASSDVGQGIDLPADAAGKWLAVSLHAGRSIGQSTVQVAYFVDLESPVFGDVVTPSITEWTRVDGPVLQLPSGAESVTVALLITSDTGAEVISDSWCAVLADTPEQAAALAADYFDGDSPDRPDARFRWAAAPHASTSVMSRPDLRPKMGDEVTVDLAGLDHSPSTVFRGRVQSLNRARKTLHDPRDGSAFTVYAYRIDAADYRGALARRTIGDEPWPLEPHDVRWNRIRQLVPDIPIREMELTGQQWVVPRDVNNTSALQLLRDTVAMADELIDVAASDGAIRARRRDEYLDAPDMWDTRLSEPYVRGGAFGVIRMSASAWTDPGDVMDYDLLVNVARVTAKQPDPDEPGQYIDRIATFINDDSRVRHGEATWSISGDGLADPDIDVLPVVARARRLVDVAGEPVWRLAGSTDAVPHMMTFDDRSQLGAILTDPGRLIMLTGAPVGRDIWRVIAFTAIWGGDGIDALSLDVEPYDMAAPAGLRFVNVAGADPITFADVATPPMTFAHALTVQSIIKD